jgi:hypothetical protein
MPFAERKMMRKAGKKITFKLDPEQETQQAPPSQVAEPKKKESKASTAPSETEEPSTLARQMGKVQVPSGFEAMIGVLKTMR